MGLRTREPRPTQTEGKFISLKNEYKALIKKKQLITPLRGQYFPAPFCGLQRRPEQHSVFLQLLSLEQLATHFPQ